MINLELINKIKKANWSDWKVEEIRITFLDYTIKLKDDENRNTLSLICKNYIGYETIGLWDESIIKNIKVVTEGDLITKSIKKIKEKYCENPIQGGGIKKINSVWLQISIELIDGIEINIVANEIIINEGI